MTLRRTGSCLAYAALLVLLGVLAVGAALPTEPVDVTPVAHADPGEPAGPGDADESPALVAEDAPPAPAPDPPAAAAPQAEADPDPCAAALDDVAAGGLPLPAGVDYQCPSTRFAHQGAACWDEWPCPGTAFIAINMSRLEGASPEYLRHVVAHEICHIIDFRDRGWSTEPQADACAAAYGF